MNNFAAKIIRRLWSMQSAMSVSCNVDIVTSKLLRTSDRLIAGMLALSSDLEQVISTNALHELMMTSLFVYFVCSIIVSAV
jgi:hypothetical protein